MNKKKEKNNHLPSLFYRIFKPLGKLIFKLYYHPTIIGKENIPETGAIIVVGNHVHVMDQCGPIFSTKRVIHYMAKKEYFDGKGAWFFKAAGCISVNREIHDDEAKNQALDILESGGGIGIFPEGTRNKTNDVFLLPLKFGVVSMAQKTGATIVPSCITGDYNHKNKNLMYRVGTPFKVPADMDLAEANEKLTKEMEKLMKENLEATGRTVEEELNSRCQDTKKK